MLVVDGGVTAIRLLTISVSARVFIIQLTFVLQLDEP